MQTHACISTYSYFYIYLCVYVFFLNESMLMPSTPIQHQRIHCNIPSFLITTSLSARLRPGSDYLQTIYQDRNFENKLEHIVSASFVSIPFNMIKWFKWILFLLPVPIPIPWRSYLFIFLIYTSWNLIFVMWDSVGLEKCIDSLVHHISI